MGAEILEGQEILIERVINRGICVQCGACVGICPYFDYFDGKVVVMDRCHADTSRCLQLCPRADYKKTLPATQKPDFSETKEIGAYQKIMIARATDKETRKRAQYGGIVSALLIYSLEKGLINSAILTDSGGHLSPGGRIARNRSDVLSCAGSRYSGSGGLSALNRAIKAGEPKLGVVGLPCQMEALARMRLMQPDGDQVSSRVVLKIGLFCTWAIDYRALSAFLKRQSMEGPFKKFDIPPPPSEKFQVKTEKGWRDFPLSDIRPMVQKGCSLCQDMTAEWADLSIGAVEGLDGWNTIVLRTDAGNEVITEMIEKGWLEIDDLPVENFEHLKDASFNKRERAIKASIEMDRE